MTLGHYERQYLSILKDLVENGTWVENPRTKTRCKTVIGRTLEIDPKDELPLLSVRKTYWQNAILEMICFIRGYTKLEEFHSLGIKTWDANAASPANPVPGKEPGLVYGASAKAAGYGFEELLKDLQDPEKRYDRGLIWNFWNVEHFPKGCLRPCMFLHQFNVVDDVLFLNTFQRSCDFPIGEVFDIVQCAFLVQILAKLANLKVGTVQQHLANVHYYENQEQQVLELLNRKPLEAGYVSALEISDDFTFDVLMHGTREEILNCLKVNYMSNEPLKFAFTA